MAVEWKKLNDVCSVHTGTQLNKEKMLEDGVYPVINGGQTSSGYTNAVNEKANSITISQGGESAGFVNWIDTDFWAGAHCYVLCDYNIDKRYLFHFLKSREKQIRSKRQGAGIPGLNRKSLMSLNIPVPSTSQQMILASKLDTFTSLISKLNGEIELRKKQFEYYRDTLLDFEGTKEVISWLSFGEDFMLKARIGWQGLTKKEYRKKGAYKLITGTDFTTDNKIAFENCVYVDKERYDQDPYIQIRESDVLITKDGTLGKIAYIEKLDMPATLNGGIFVVRDLTERVKQKFLMYYLTSSVFKDWMKRNHTQGSIKHLTQTLLSKFTIPVIAADKQCAIIEKLDSFTTLISKLEEERDLHQKQYEYYREKLLTFE